MLFAFLSFSVAIFISQQILASYKSIIVVRLFLLIASCSIAGAGFVSLGDSISMHVTLVAVAFILIVLSMFLIPRLIPQFQSRVPMSLCWGLGIGTAVMVALGQSIIANGIAQRLATSTIWLK